jgi:DNA-binding response OmpR family regulator
MESAEPHLLVVDDDARIRELLRRYLASTGFRVTTASDAAEARTKLSSMEFDLVVLDVMMPGENGFDLTQSLRKTSDELVHLTAAEAALLSSLVHRPNEPVSREELATEAQFSGNVRTVDVQMTRLRRKIERDLKFPRYLQTVRGTGYVFKPD